MTITQRDRKLFRHLSNYGMLSTKHIKELIFGGIASTTVLRRLRLLEEERFLKRLTGLESQDVLWIITDKAAEFDGGEQCKKFWNKNLLEHDFKLLNLRLELERQGIAKSWVPEHEIRYLLFKKYETSTAKKMLIPDGLMVTEAHHIEVSVAIELELNLKNKERLKETLASYQDKKDLTFLWYICQSKTIAKSVLAIWNDTPAKSRAKLYTSHIDDVITNPMEAFLFDGQRRIKVHELWKAKSAHSPAQRVSTLTEGSPITPSKLRIENRKDYPVPNAPPNPAVITDHPPITS